jgi:ribosomal protein S15P/S13E
LLANGFLLNVLRALVISGLTAVATILWSLNQQVAVLDERIANVLKHSDRRDADFERDVQAIERALQQIEQQLQKR